jgi:hypothetical protein
MRRGLRQGRTTSRGSEAARSYCCKGWGSPKGDLSDTAGLIEGRSFGGARDRCVRRNGRPCKISVGPRYRAIKEAPALCQRARAGRKLKAFPGALRLSWYDDRAPVALHPSRQGPMYAPGH